MGCCGCGNKCALWSRIFLFLFLAGGIALSIMCIWSCSFLDSGFLDRQQQGIGLYRSYNEEGTCVVYPDDFPFTNSDQTARICGLIAPIIAAGAGLLGLIQFLFCNICCDRCIISCFFTCAQIAQALTFFMFNGTFCTAGLGCKLSYGSYYSIGAWGAYFVASVLLCFSPKPDPLCCNKKDAEAERMQEEYTTPVIEPDEDGLHQAVPE